MLTPARAWGARVGLAVAVAAALAAIPYAVTDRGATRQVSALEAALAKTRAEIAALEADNAALIRDITALRRSPEKIADIAREKLHLARPNELVIVIPEAGKGAP